MTVRLVTPDRVLLDATAEAVELPSASGYLEALYGASAGEQRFFVASGFVEVLPERVTILAEMAMHPEEIDRAGAQADLERGQKMWAEAGDDGGKYDDANEIIRQAEEEIASADGRATA